MTHPVPDQSLPSTHEQPQVPTQTPIPEASDPTPSKKKRALKTVLSILGISAGLVIGKILIPIAFIEADNNVTVEDGYLFEASTYSIMFPGEPDPVADVPAGYEAVIWSNKQKMYQSANVDVSVVTAASLEDAVAGCASANEAELVSVAPYKLGGQDGALAEGTFTSGELAGKTVWCAAALSPDSSSLALLTQVGKSRDDAFFKSFTLTP